MYVVVGIIIVIAIASSLNLTKKKYDNLVTTGLKRTKTDEIELIKETDLNHLPKPVQEYLKYVGVVGKEKVLSYTVYMTGEFKMDEEQDFSKITVNQTSYHEESTRLFYMKLIFNGLKIAGIHHYENQEATMKVRILDVFKIVDESGEIMNKAETVTVFNDMALLAPATLIDTRITWEEIDDYSCLGTFTNGEYSITATLYFNEKYQLINFVSDDRYALVNGVSENVRWETPITKYKNIDGYNLPYIGSAIWKYEDRDFEYIKLVIEYIEYNKEIK